ncbi:HD-GYP domain-containing protein [Tissierella sp.]|uniref:HD-GYP domain-containing protein n=1 Tax=Tissierella sp. TaxID=41274 RepID=UPI002859CCB6|nr:HD-GYP domain-containing protein [Tissierella sp.]MDR7857602.1 HD-GYP domain-containing protein [Tissierella sp.]
MKPDRKTYIYIGVLFILAIITYGFLIRNFTITDIKMLLFWTVLTIIVESLLIMLPNDSTGVSVGSAINLASIIVGGPLLGTTASFIGLLFRCPRVPKYGYTHLLNTPYYITIFNVSQSIIVTSAMGLIYLGAGGKIGGFSLFLTILIVVLGTIFNTVIISKLIALLNNQKFTKIWFSNIYGIIGSIIGVGTIGIIIALAFISYGYGAVILFFGPLLLARYTFKLYMETRNLYLSTIQAFNSVMEAKDPYTSGHASRVEKYATRLAEAYGLSYVKIQNVKNAAILHDIGKIGVNDNILNKSAKLTKLEYEEIMKHSSIGAEIISKVDFLKKISGIIMYHHERYDGKGYPEGISGDDIPIEACILAIADSYDAMTSDRPYREALNKEEALQEIINNAGTQFHPALAEKFVDMLNE